MLVRITNRKDPDQTACSEAVSSGSALFVKAFLAGILFLKFQNINHNKGNRNKLLSFTSLGAILCFVYNHPTCNIIFHTLTIFAAETVY